MTREDIEKAADDFADREYEISDIDRDPLYKGFYHGANWRINSVWHNSKTEVPDVNTIVLVEKEDGSIWQYKVFAKSQMLGWKRWAYIKDLIPNE
ncbi:hypothetical protein K0G57_20140 [Bacteroides fragilis]|jgi:hypothetical protein|uniref:hypothetical protein n=1 Tax=Phocaeicola vulgatus TaxID=821 RepID=UPI001F298234|nr:hypothetical protein [Phocaeicola vulgatus]MCE9189179.1 hypothetical protein [Bacteroides fragilis]MCE9377168.1 hypothetical protein [Phocaeicola vulgatus]